MASILKVDEMQGVTSAGDITITSEGGSATMQLQQGVAKHWTQFTQQSTQTLNDSFNCSAITDNGVGSTVLSFSNNMASSNFSTQCEHSDNQSNTAALTKTTSSYRVDARNDAGTFGDRGDYGTIVHGDLA
jgi:hypothetical protein|tara:strand:- start:31 stop:423 length:393 start_codon:yes stop_codon:yes gene_type:complete